MRRCRDRRDRDRIFRQCQCTEQNRPYIVDYADLDLASDDGQATLQGRLKGAVRQVCGSYDPKNLVDAQDHGVCMTEANASAQRASVTIMAAAKSGKSVQTAMVISN